MESAVNIFDCGGRGGSHRSWKNFGLPINYFSFEPESLEFTDLKVAESEEKIDGMRFQTFNVALDEKSGSSELYIYELRELSSLFPLNHSETYRFGHVPLVELAKVPALSLDDLCNEKGIYPDFLSIDAQGGTLRVLNGGKNTLRHLVGLRCEVEFIQLYKEAPLFAQVFSYLQDLSYKLLRIETCGSGAYGVSTEMNKFSVGPNDAIPAGCDAIFVNTIRLSELEADSTNPVSAITLAYFILFCIHNGCGYYGVEILDKLQGKKSLEEFYNALTPFVLESLTNQVGFYLSLSRININAGFDGSSIFRSLFNKELKNEHLENYVNTREKINKLYGL